MACKMSHTAGMLVCLLAGAACCQGLTPPSDDKVVRHIQPRSVSDGPLPHDEGGLTPKEEEDRVSSVSPPPQTDVCKPDHVTIQSATYKEHTDCPADQKICSSVPECTWQNDTCRKRVGGGSLLKVYESCSAELPQTSLPHIDVHCGDLGDLQLQYDCWQGQVLDPCDKHDKHDVTSDIIIFRHHWQGTIPSSTTATATATATPTSATTVSSADSISSSSSPSAATAKTILPPNNASPSSQGSGAGLFLSSSTWSSSQSPAAQWKDTCSCTLHSVSRQNFQITRHYVYGGLSEGTINDIVALKENGDDDVPIPAIPVESWFPIRTSFSAVNLSFNFERSGCDSALQFIIIEALHESVTVTCDGQRMQSTTQHTSVSVPTTEDETKTTETTAPTPTFSITDFFITNLTTVLLVGMGALLLLVIIVVIVISRRRTRRRRRRRPQAVNRPRYSVIRRPSRRVVEPECDVTGTCNDEEPQSLQRLGASSGNPLYAIPYHHRPTPTSPSPRTSCLQMYYQSSTLPLAFSLPAPSAHYQTHSLPPPPPPPVEAPAATPRSPTTTSHRESVKYLTPSNRPLLQSQESRTSQNSGWELKALPGPRPEDVQRLPKAGRGDKRATSYAFSS